MPHLPFSNFDVVAIAASAGGVQALRGLLRHLPAGFPAPIVIAQHVARRSLLTMMLEKETPLSVAWAEEGMRLRAGAVFLVPPRVSLVLDGQHRCRLTDTPSRYLFDAPDALFGSVASLYGARGLGVVLTGAGSAGAAGACAIQRAGGLVIAQDNASSAWFSMPSAAISAGAATLVLPLEIIARALVTLVSVPGGPGLFGIASRAAPARA